MTTLDNKAAFFHVIDSHRWLAASGCAWNLVGPNGPQNGRFDQDLPNIAVMIRDCFLLHARSLIKFHRGAKKGCTDIVLSDFCIPPIDASLAACLDGYEKPIEVHLLHLTDWRDVDYRDSHTPKRGTAVRPDWDKMIPVIAEKLIHECLKHAAEKGGDWAEPFRDLYEATAARYLCRSREWPAELRERADVEQYLRSLGL